MKRLLLICLVIIILMQTVSAAIYATDFSMVVGIKYDNGQPTLSEDLINIIILKPPNGEFLLDAPPVDPESELINVISITKNGVTKQHNFQTPSISTIYIFSPSEDVVNTMQTTTTAGYPVLELYWDYDKSPSEPWRFYMRVNTVGSGYAVFSDFRTKQAWRKPITASRVQEIINSGTIPAWESVR